MKKTALLIALALTATDLRAAQPAIIKRGEIERLPDSSRPGVAWFVTVADGPLLFTEQIFPRNVSANPQAQVAEVIASLDTLLKEAGGDLGRVIRLHFYVADDAVTP